jgi:NAD+ synthase
VGIRAVIENIAPILRAAGCYQRRDQFITQVVPEYDEGWKSKIVLPRVTQNTGYNIFSLVVESPIGEQKTVRLPLEPYLGIVASTNFKQRTRKMMEYYHADRLNYVVVGTPNRLEYDQGFFVKNGDGAADIKPIAHLYKTQVYQLADALDIPSEIRQRPPTTDTYSLPQSQEEFFYALPLHKLDLCLYGLNHNVEASEVADAIGLSKEHVRRVYQDIQQKRRATRYLHAAPLLIEDVTEAVACS